jgi:hypothetical protein
MNFNFFMATPDARIISCSQPQVMVTIVTARMSAGIQIRHNQNSHRGHQDSF